MKELFDQDSAFMKWVRRFFNLVALNLIWAVCCIPVVTIGAATVALYSTVASLRKDQIEDEERTQVLKHFFAAFKKEFKQATMLFFIMLAMLFVVAADVWCAFSFSETVPYAIKLLCFIPAVLYALISGYIFPFQAKFFNTIGETLKNVVLMALSHLHVSIAVAFMNLIPVVFFIRYPSLFIETSIFWFIAGSSLITWINWIMLSRIFDSYVDEKEI